MVDRDVALKASSGVLMTAAAAAAGSTPAVADPVDPVDLRAPVPISTWQGWYFGGSVGASWLRSVQDDTGAINSIFENQVVASFSTGGATATANGIGWQGGLDLGYNWQSGNFVYGLEADVSWLGHTSASSGGAFATIFGLHGGSYGGYGNTLRTSQMNALGTFRARFGFDFNGTLPYVTFGVAGAEMKNTFTLNGFSSTGIPAFASVSESKWTPGIVLGGGIEHKLSEKWTLRGEVDWIGFQTEQMANPLSSPTYDALSSTHGPVSFSNNVVIARIGLNYRY